MVSDLNWVVSDLNWVVSDLKWVVSNLWCQIWTEWCQIWTKWCQIWTEWGQTCVRLELSGVRLELSGVRLVASRCGGVSVLSVRITTVLQYYSYTACVIQSAWCRSTRRSDMFPPGSLADKTSSTVVTCWWSWCDSVSTTNCQYGPNDQQKKNVRCWNVVHTLTEIAGMGRKGLGREVEGVRNWRTWEAAVPGLMFCNARS